MGDGLKSVAVALVILFIFLVVLGDEFTDRELFGVPVGGRRPISFCDSLGDAPVLGLLPCFLLNLVVVLGVVLSVFLVIGLARKLLR